MIAMKEMEALGQRVEDAMKERRMAAYELAAKIGRQPSWVSRFLNGGMANLPDPAMLRQIADVVGVPLEELLRTAGYLDPPRHDEGEAARLGVDGGEDAAFFHALMAYLPALGPAQRAHLIETARMMTGAAITRASSPAASDRPADEPMPHPLDRPEES